MAGGPAGNLPILGGFHAACAERVESITGPKFLVVRFFVPVRRPAVAARSGSARKPVTKPSALVAGKSFRGDPLWSLESYAKSSTTTTFFCCRAKCRVEKPFGV